MREKIIILATANQHKAEELKRILSDYEIKTLNDIDFNEEIIEDGDTFEENALIKARFIHKITCQTVIADDSGLCIEYLKGQPGIYSARYAGEQKNDQDNNQKLLDELKDVKEENRKAAFVSAAAVVFSDGSQYVTRGEVQGSIGFEGVGENGFGYDPLFICDENNRTYAQMDMEEKNVISHRRRAFEKLKPIIDTYFLEDEKLTVQEK